MAQPGVSSSCDGELKEDLQGEHVSLDHVVWKKLDRRILPLFACFFLFAKVDTSNIGNARIAGLQSSLSMSNYQYSLVLTLGHLPFVVSEFPSTLLLQFVGPDLMLPAMFTLWAAISAAQGLVNSYPKFLACRLLQGAVGGGLFPCLIFCLSAFYPRERLQTRIASFYALASLSSLISGFLAAAIERLNGEGGRPGWAWIFILEGSVTMIIGVISFFLLPRSPRTARFLTEKEQHYVASILKQAGSVSEDDKNDKFSWPEIFKAIKSPHVWLFAANAFFNGTVMLGVARFEPTIVASLGYSGSQAQLMSVPPFALNFVLCLISATISDRYQCRGYIVIFFSVFEVIGFTIFYASRSNHIRYASLFFTVPGALCVVPATITWVTNNSAPHTRRATTVAIISIMSESGGILSTWLLGSWSSGPDFKVAMITFIAMSVCVIIVSIANLAYLSRQNRLKAERRQVMRKEEEPAGLGDRSAWFVYSL